MKSYKNHNRDQCFGVMRFERIVFWGPHVISHVTDLIDELSIQFPDTDFVYCADQGLLKDRKDIGLEEIKTSTYTILVKPEHVDIDSLIKNEIDGTLHVFIGIRLVKCIISALNVVKRYPKVRFGIMSEPRVREGFKGKLRIIHSLLTEGWIRERTSFVLAIGAHGIRWYLTAGYAKEKLFPFAYFVRSGVVNKKYQLIKNNKINLAYVGRIVDEKGIFDILKSVSEISEISVKLFIVGDGIDKKRFLSNCADREIDYEYLGVIPANEISAFVSEIDILLLASTTTNDGWGVVVSEALMMGTAVVLTKPVGASIVFMNSIFGRVVEMGCPTMLKNAVLDIVFKKQIDMASREERSTLAINMLSSNFGAKYFDSVISYIFHGGSVVTSWTVKL